MRTYPYCNADWLSHGAAQKHNEERAWDVRTIVYVAYLHWNRILKLKKSQRRRISDAYKLIVSRMDAGCTCIGVTDVAFETSQLGYSTKVGLTVKAGARIHERIESPTVKTLATSDHAISRLGYMHQVTKEWRRTESVSSSWIISEGSKSFRAYQRIYIVCVCTHLTAEQNHREKVITSAPVWSREKRTRELHISWAIALRESELYIHRRACVSSLW